MSDLISVIIPVYNASQYLDQCIRSIQAQTYKNLEIILIDDGSTDSSACICEKYQKTDGRILFLQQKNFGSVIARKTGLKKANGKYIGFVDADDYIEPDMYEKLYIKMKDSDMDFIQSGMIIDDNKICNYQECIIDFSALDKATYISKNIFENLTMSFNLWSKLFKAELVKDAYMQLPDNQEYGEDLLCLCNYIIKCKKIYMCKDAFYHYRIRENSLSDLHWPESCMEVSKLHDYVIRFLKENGLLNECGDSARFHYKRRILSAMVEDHSSGIRALRYKMNTDTLDGKKIALYGAGKVGKDYYYQILQNDRCEIVAWADKVKYGKSGLISVCRPDALQNVKYDMIILAVKNKTVADEIRTELVQNGICEDDAMILWEEPVVLW